MRKLEQLSPQKVFRYFEEITAIPRGSGNMSQISSYCETFARERNLKVLRDSADNVIIFKPATAGYEKEEPVILQGHLDMVCQKDQDREIDFETEGLDIYMDGDYIKARGTTLGADNGIAVAMMLAILDSQEAEHPALEAVFTTDEEVGMIGASRLDLASLQGKRMINMDAESPDVLTVSCAGGSDFQMELPMQRKQAEGTVVQMTVSGLQGGHSGVEIHKGRINANRMMARILNRLQKLDAFELICIDGGDKGNAIPTSCTARVVVQHPEAWEQAVSKEMELIRQEVASREPGFSVKHTILEKGTFDVFESSLRDHVIFLLLCAPDGVQQMSADIEGLVETSLNLGILKTEPTHVFLHFALRSNKKSALQSLEDQLAVFASMVNCKVKTGGHYPPWEFRENSQMQQLYKEKFYEKFGCEPSVEAIHAGLECGVFASKIEGLDCIAIGPEMFDIHTPKERLSISSTKAVYEIVLAILKDCKSS